MYIYFPPFYNLDHHLFTYCLIYIVSKYIFASVSMAYNVEENHQITANKSSSAVTKCNANIEVKNDNK